MERYFENPEQAGFRFVGASHEIANIRHSGWYTDNAGDGETVHGVVYQVTGKNGMPRFVAGYSDPWAGGAILDLSEVFTGERGDECTGPNSLDSCLDAARAGDGMAECMAEKEREYQAAWQAGNRWSDLGADISVIRGEVLAILKERKTVKGVDAPSLCGAIRARVADLLQEIQDKRNERAKLADGDYIAEWIPGFWTGEERLQAAFCDGAGVDRFPG